MTAQPIPSGFDRVEYLASLYQFFPEARFTKAGLRS
jgi:hypothetical protein